LRRGGDERPRDDRPDHDLTDEVDDKERHSELVLVLHGLVAAAVNGDVDRV
jgi:hypothetical protein